MSRQAPMTGAGGEAMVSLYDGKPPAPPAPLFTAPVSARLRQVLVTCPGRRAGTLTLQIVRAGSGGLPGDDRTQILASGLPVEPGAAVELIGQTAGGYIAVWPGDQLYGHQDPPGAVHVLAYGAVDSP